MPHPPHLYSSSAIVASHAEDKISDSLMGSQNSLSCHRYVRLDSRDKELHMETQQCITFHCQSNTSSVLNYKTF
jgi:hypothetical protein